MTVPDNVGHPTENRVDAERVVFFADAIVAVTALFLSALIVTAVSPTVGFSSLFLLWLVPVVRRISWVARGVSRAHHPAVGSLS